ncbi:MAG TPA: hypothetical protein VK386_04545 [Acidimicrobiales bacterium]|nr:hypothetical protein [Acidimicrobiales bacterium]
MRRLVTRVLGIAVVLCFGASLTACSSGSPTASTSPPATPPGNSVPLVQGGTPTNASYLVYWDQNEEEDFLSMPSGLQGQLLPAWDANGQMCILPDGRWVVGYDPTLPQQDDFGGVKPYKQPGDGEELDEPNGSFSGETLYVPGEYKMPGQSIGSDSPGGPTVASGKFNNNQTYTGCLIVPKTENILASDIATAQGNYPPPSSGRLVEWFAPNYTTYCIVYGPDAGGYSGAHHTDGSGGLEQPGMMALAPNGDVLVPTVGTQSVLRFAAASLPTSAAQCPNGVYPRSKLHITSFVKGLPFPAGIAFGSACNCYAVSSYIGPTAIEFVTPDGTPDTAMGDLPGTSVQDLGKSPNQYNPFGMAFAPDGTLYFIDIHIVCKGLLSGCGPGNLDGRVMRVTFTNGQPSTPVTVSPTGGQPGTGSAAGNAYGFPTSVTVCAPSSTQVCPYPTGAIAAPLSGPSEDGAPDEGPPSDAPATAGFG